MSGIKPAAQKALEGNPGKRPIPVEPDIAPGCPSPPGDLSGEAFAEWSRIVPDLHNAGLLAKVDRAYLVAYCEAWSQFNASREHLAEFGPVTRGRNGEPVKNPAAQVMRDSADMMLKFGSRFGLSPQDRARLGKVQEPEAPSGPDATVLSILSS